MSMTIDLLDDFLTDVVRGAEKSFKEIRQLAALFCVELGVDLDRIFEAFFREIAGPHKTGISVLGGFEDVGCGTKAVFLIRAYLNPSGLDQITDSCQGGQIICRHLGKLDGGFIVIPDPVGQIFS